MATWWLPPGSDSRLQPAPSLVLTAALVQGKSDIISKHLQVADSAPTIIYSPQPSNTPRPSPSHTTEAPEFDRAQSVSASTTMSLVVLAVLSFYMIRRHPNWAARTTVQAGGPQTYAYVDN